jgi:two-component system NarL family sensor kinase
MAAYYLEPGATSSGEAPPQFPPLRGASAAVMIDGDGRIREASPPAAAMLGFEPVQLEGRTLREIAAEGWQAAADVASARVRYGSLESFELALRGRSGRRTLVEMTASQDGGDAGQTRVSWSERRLRRASASEVEAPEDGRFAYALLRAHEAERERLAALLHEELAPVMVMMRFQLEEALTRQLADTPAGQAQAIQEAVNHLRELTGTLLGACSRLHPRILSDLGLQAAVEALCREVSESSQGLEVSFRFEVRDDEIPRPLHLEVYRIIEEGLANVVAHAAARRALVTLYRSGPEVCALVEDDGRGFEANPLPALPEGSGVGLQAIRWRVEATGGRLLFAPAVPHGTRIGAAWKA